MELNKSFQISEIETELIGILNSGEVEKTVILLFEYFDYFQVWKFQSKTLEFAELTKRLCPFYKCTYFYLASLAFDQQDFQKCQESIKFLMSEHNNSIEKIQNSLGKERFQKLCKLTSELHQIGIQEDLLYIKNKINVKIDAPTLIESLILSENKIHYLTEAAKKLKTKSLDVLFTFLTIDKGNQKIQNWVKQNKNHLTILEKSEEIIGPEQDINLVASLLAKLDSTNEDKLNETTEEVADSTQDLSMEKIIEKDNKDVFHGLLFARKLPNKDVNIFERSWDYQLAHELHEDNEYYLCLLVLEFVKTTMPLDLVRLKMVVHLELSCCEKLELVHRAERLKREMLTIN